MHTPADKIIYINKKFQKLQIHIQQSTYEII